MSISLDDLSSNLSFTTGGKSRTGRATFLPEPERRPRRVHRHLRRRPHRRAARTPSRGGCRSAWPTGLPGSSSATTAARPGSTTARSSRTSASTPSSAGRSASTASSPPASTRCAGGRGTSRPGSRTWTSTASTPRSTSPPSCPASRASACSSPPRTPSWPWPRSGRGTTGTSRSGRAPPRSRIIPCQIPWLLDPELGAEEIRRNAERGFKAVTFSEGPQALGLAVAAHRALGPRHAGLRGDGHGGQPPHRLLGHVARHRRRRPCRHRRRPVLRLRHVRGRRLAVLPDPGALPRAPDLHVGGRHRLGGRAARPPRPHARLPRHVRHLDTRHRPHPVGGAAPQLLVLRRGGSLGVRPARPHRRRQHPPRGRLPALRLDVAEHPGQDPRRRSAACRQTTSARSPGRTPPASTATRCRRRYRPTRTPTDPNAY